MNKLWDETPEMVSEQNEFIRQLDHLQKEIHQWAKDKGLVRPDRSDAEIIALCHSELSKTLEGIRKQVGASDHIPDFTNLEEAIADLIIRFMDWAGGKNLRIGRAIVAKMRFNETRPHKHGKLI